MDGQCVICDAPHREQTEIYMVIREWYGWEPYVCEDEEAFVVRRSGDHDGDTSGDVGQATHLDLGIVGNTGFACNSCFSGLFEEQGA